MSPTVLRVIRIMDIVCTFSILFSVRIRKFIEKRGSVCLASQHAMNAILDHSPSQIIPECARHALQTVTSLATSLVTSSMQKRIFYPKCVIALIYP